MHPSKSREEIDKYIMKGVDGGSVLSKFPRVKINNLESLRSRSSHLNEIKELPTANTEREE